MHQLVFHVLPQSGDELKSLLKEQLGKRSRDIAPISNHLASQMFDHLGNGLTIIDLACSQAASEQLASIIHRQMQLETKEPAHARLTPSPIRRKHAAPPDPLRTTDFQT